MSCLQSKVRITYAARMNTYSRVDYNIYLNIFSNENGPIRIVLVIQFLYYGTFESHIQVELQ